MAGPAAAVLPYPGPGATDPYDYKSYLFIENGDCTDGDADGTGLPSSFNCKDDWKYTNYRDALPPDDEEYDPEVSQNPQEFYGVRGTGLNRAWEVSTGRPDVIISVLDSGIMWSNQRAATKDDDKDGDRELIRYEPELWSLLGKHHLNRFELPMPEGGPNLADDRFDGYDVGGAEFTVAGGDVTYSQTGPDGFFNVYDYWWDSRVTSQPHRGDLNENGFDNSPDGTIEESAGWPAPSVDEPGDAPVVDPEDLIRMFSDGEDDDGNGYVDDISGWDFFENDNNPQDDTNYGHGSGEAKDSGAEAGFDDGQCPNCMVMSMRVGDSFIADVNHWAEAVIYAVDNGARVVQEALGTLNHTSFGQAAADYAYENGVIINASEADEAAGHHNWPAAYDHTMVVNSILKFDDVSRVTQPYSYLYFNGCTNFGGYTFTSIPSTSCSSEATGRSSGVSGLLFSAALNAIENERMTSYIRDDGTQAPFPLSTEEAMQLWRLAADDIDLSSDCTLPVVHDFCDDNPLPDVPVPQATANNYDTTIPASVRYQSVKGWDFFFGYGRNNAARLLRFIGREGAKEYLPPGPYGVGASNLSAQDRIPPEADISYPPRWRQYAFDPGTGNLLVPDDTDDPLDPDAVVVEGHVAANRVTAEGGTYDWILEWAPHAQGLNDPVNRPAAGNATCPVSSQEKSDGPWTVAACGTGLTEAFQGELGRIPVAQLANALTVNPYPWNPGTDPTSEFRPEGAAIRLRVRVVAHPADDPSTIDVNEATADTVNNEAVMQKQIDVYPASESILRYDIGLDGQPSGGAGAPSFHDVDGDGVDEMLLPTEDGVIHAYTNLATGAELPGWPVTTGRYPGWRTGGENAYTNDDLSVDDARASLLLGSVGAADLDDDGELEVIAGDLEGRLHVWEPDGETSPGFPVSVDLSLSREPPCAPATIPACDDYSTTTPSRPGTGTRDSRNDRDWGINSAPAIGDLDASTQGLEIVVGSNDGHVYAWHEDGSPVNGWPVILRDPEKVLEMDPTTRHVTYVPGAGDRRGTKVLVSPSLGDVDADGDLEVVIGVNEEYVEPPNANFAENPLLPVIQALDQDPGNTRMYVLHHDGAAHSEDDAAKATSHTQDQAYLEGWPVPLAMAVTELLPYVGEGTSSPAVLANIRPAADNDPQLEIVVTSMAGPGYVLNHDGSSFYGNGPDGTYRTLSSAPFGPGSLATDAPSLVAVGAMAIGSLDQGGHLTIAGPGAGLNRLLDVVAPALQFQAEDHILGWNASTGQFEPNFPITVNDLQFFTEPILGEVDGLPGAEIIQSTAMNDLVAAGLARNNATAIRYFTGGWGVTAAGLGAAPLGGGPDDKVHIGFVTREGWLRLIPTNVTEGTAAACAALGEWPEYGHDAFNSGNYHTDAERPYPVTGLAANVNPDRTVAVTFRATGDDRYCGRAQEYRVRILPGSPAEPEWEDGTNETTHPTDKQSGEPDSVTVGPLEPGTYTIMLRAYDDAGNGSAIAFVRATVPGPAPPLPPGPGPQPPGQPEPEEPPGPSPAQEGGASQVPPLCPGQEALAGQHIVGTPGPDRIVGTPERDVICGLGGDDELRGLDGGDLIFGGDGNDVLIGGQGEDKLRGESGNDRLAGSGGDDRATGGDGNDRLRGSGGDDRLRGGDQDDRLGGGPGEDRLAGGPGDDRLAGGPARDRCRGGTGTDSVRGCEA